MKSMGADAADLTATMGDAWDAPQERFREVVERRPVRAVLVSVAVEILLGFVEPPLKPLRAAFRISARFSSRIRRRERARRPRV